MLEAMNANTNGLSRHLPKIGLTVQAVVRLVGSGMKVCAASHK
jgi:hypothetical protein